MATTTKCPHGFETGTCMICSTLAQPSPVAGGSSGRVSGGRVSGGRVEVLTEGGRPRRSSFGVSVLGVLCVLAVLGFGVWFLVHLVWGFLHLVELALVGLFCGVVGYKLGVVVGRHRAPR